MKFFTSEQQFDGNIDASVLFCGITRNSEKYIGETLAALTKMRERFRSSDIVIYENDSVDKTVEEIQKFDVELLTGRDGSKQYHGIDNFTARSIKQLADYRQKLKENIVANHLADFVVVLDFDMAAISWDGFFNSFFYHGWDVIGSNSKCIRDDKLVFYDYLAHRMPGQKESDVQQVWEFANLSDPQLIPVDSVFGGLCIYSWEAFSSGTYDAKEDMIDHVCFHESLRKLGFDKIFMNTYMVTLHQ